MLLVVGACTTREMRADARLNRAQIVTAARELIAAHGPDASTEEIARRAEVGVATVYRHFPDRPALVRAVALESFQHVVELARAAEDDEPSAWRALTRLLHDAVTELRLATWLSIWFASTWDDLRRDPENQRLRRVLINILDRLVRAAQSDDALRPDVGAVDLVLMLATVLRPIPGVPNELTQRGAARHLDILLDGLRAEHAVSALPVPAPTLPSLLGGAGESQESR